MAIREICKWPEDVLKIRAPEVNDIDFGTVTLIEDMIETMYQENGVGLAAPQVAVSRRVIVVDASPKTGFGGLITVIMLDLSPERALTWVVSTGGDDSSLLDRVNAFFVLARHEGMIAASDQVALT